MSNEVSFWVVNILLAFVLVTLVHRCVRPESRDRPEPVPCEERR